MLKLRNSMGREGMKSIEAVLLGVRSEIELGKNRWGEVDTQRKNLTYPTDADLLHRIREKIVRHIERGHKEVTLRKLYRTSSLMCANLNWRIK